jgi:hypothetical protein
MLIACKQDTIAAAVAAVLFFFCNIPATFAVLDISLGMRDAYIIAGDSLSVPVNLLNHEMASSVISCKFTLRISDTSSIRFSGATSDRWTAERLADGTMNFKSTVGPIHYGDYEIGRLKFSASSGAHPGDTIAIKLSSIEIGLEASVLKRDTVRSRIVIVAQKPAALPGDVTNDGVVNSQDAQTILQCVANAGAVSINAPCQTIGLRQADISGNGRITAFDAALVLSSGIGQMAALDGQGLLPSSVSLSDARVTISAPECAATDVYRYHVYAKMSAGLISAQMGFWCDSQIVYRVKTATSSVPGAIVMTSSGDATRRYSIALMSSDGLNLQNVELATIVVQHRMGKTAGGLKLTNVFMNEGPSGSVSWNPQYPVEYPNGWGYNSMVSVSNSQVLIPQSLPRLSRAGLRIDNSRFRPVSVALFDLTGRIIVNQSFTAGTEDIAFPADRITAGRYFWHVQVGNGMFSIPAISVR